MKIGKLSETIFDRSVYKQLNHKNKNILSRLTSNQDGAVAAFTEGCRLISKSVSVSYTLLAAGEIAVAAAANGVMALGGSPFGVSLSILVNPRIRETKLRTIMSGVNDLCNELNISVMDCDVTVTPDVSRAVVTATVIGTARSKEVRSTSDMQPGMDIVMAGLCGQTGAYVLASDYRSQLQSRLPDNLIANVTEYRNTFSIKGIMDSIEGCEYETIHCIGEGGVFGALWEMAGAANLGISTYLYSMPVSQEIIEISEFYGINPYELCSVGAVLIASADGEALARKLTTDGIEAAVIGTFTGDNDKVVNCQDEKRFLELPKGDALYEVICSKQETDAYEREDS